MIQSLLVITIALPLMASLLTAASWLFFNNRGEQGENLTALTLIAACFVSMAGITALSIIYLAQPVIQPIVVDLDDWFTSGKLKIHLRFVVDYVSLGFAGVISMVAFVTVLFSRNYLHREAGFQRYFAVMGMFISAMLAITFSGNAVAAFLGWELVGASSYLLIAFNYHRVVAADNANRAFITNRVGDAGFLLAIYLGFHWLGNTNWLVIGPTSTAVPQWETGLIATGIVIAAMAKSAAVPFSSWISRALEGPTPSSAIFYGSVMVHAGVFLLIRIAPLTEQVPALQVLLVITGLATAIYGYLCALVQTDVKSALMFSTTAQVGLMFVECGLGYHDLALAHLLVNAVWRAYQFLHAPAQMHFSVYRARQVPDWLQKRQFLYTAAIQRFWLDDFADAMVVRPSGSLASEVKMFDREVIGHLAGFPTQAGTVSSIGDWEHKKMSGVMTASANSSELGLLGRIMDRTSRMFHWFEEQLVLKGSGEGLTAVIGKLGAKVQHVEALFCQPRYLWLMILATAIVVL
ncbi:MAG: proton-conducting transporter membrane subunit [Gammaproteobacteria bacterium]|nr:proton-conducting transporter membrane subunit [Gammaproteobacteria bacterium]